MAHGMVGSIAHGDVANVADCALQKPARRFGGNRARGRLPELDDADGDVADAIRKTCSQISEAELEAIARGGGLPELDDAEAGGSEASRRLLGNYETPQRCGPCALCSGED